MKRILYHMSLLLLAAILSGCERRELCPDVLQQICFDAGLDMQVSTKAMSERTSAAGFSCMALKEDGSTLFNASTTTSGSYEVVPGRYWPSTGELSFYGVLPNVTLSNSTGTVTCPVGTAASPLSGTEDYIVAANRDVPNATSPVPMQFSHILSQVSGLTLTGPSDGAKTTISSASFSHPSYGTYNLMSGIWSSTGGSRTESFSGFGTISGTTAKSVSSDFTLIPGSYTLTVSYTVTKDGISASYSKSGAFTLEPGRKSTISAALSDDFRDLSVSVSVAPWNATSGWSETCSDSSKPTDGRRYRVNTNPTGNYGWKQTSYKVINRCVYQSDNAGNNDSMAVMSITVSGYSTFTLYAYSSGEADYDYILISKPDENLLEDIGDNFGEWMDASELSGLASVQTAVTSPDNDPKTPGTMANYRSVSISGLDSSRTYTIQVIYGKDASVNQGLDRGFIFIP